jgi:hypothetical protein
LKLSVSQERTHESEGENKLSKKLMLLVALSLAFAAMFMFAGTASAQTTCPPGTTPSTVFNAAGNPVDRHFVCVPTSTVVTPTTAFPVDGFVGSTQEFDIRRVSSGAANPRVDISNTGDNVNLSAPVQQTVNTGNVLNEQGVVTGPGTGTGCVDDFGFAVDCGFINDGFIGTNNGCVDAFGFLVPCGFNDGFIGGFDGIDGFGGDVDLVGPTLTVGGTLDSNVTQTINQAAAAGR